MPIAPKYDWEETEHGLEVRVQLVGVPKSAADVCATDAMIKVNCAPYLLLLDLAHDVNDALSVATITADGVNFGMTKKEVGLWGSLTTSAPKEEVLQRRNASVERSHQRLAEARKERAARKEREAKDATQRQMDLERRKRAAIEANKEGELSAERNKLLAWQGNVAGNGDGGDHGGEESDYEDEEDPKQDELGSEANASLSAEPAPDHPDYYGRGYQPDKLSSDHISAAKASVRHGKQTAPAHDGDGDEMDAANCVSLYPGADMSWGEVEEQARAQELTAVKEVTFTPLPPPRARLNAVPITFTQLETGHLPAREGREEEIKQYKKKAADEKLLADSVDVADRQPLFLKDKGDGLYKQGNYRGALNAYARAIELDNAIPLLWANRAACHLQLQDAAACVADCDAALELLLSRQKRYEDGNMTEQEVAAYTKQVVKVLVRRAQAHVLAGRVQAAADDYTTALKYDRSNEALMADLAELQAALVPPDAASLRARGDARFRAGDADGAAQAFTALLALLTEAMSPTPPARTTPVPVTCSSKLSGAGAAANGSDVHNLQHQPPQQQLPEQQSLSQQRASALSNRAACYLLLEQYEKAVADCSTALQLLMSCSPFADSSSADLAQSDTPGPHGLSSSTDSGLTNHACSAVHQWVGRLQAYISQQHDNVTECSSTGAASSSMTGHSMESIGIGSSSCDWPWQSVAGSVGRLLSRRGAALGHLKQYSEAAEQYHAASTLAQLIGDEARAVALAADAAKLAGLAAGTLIIDHPTAGQGADIGSSKTVVKHGQSNKGAGVLFGVTNKGDVEVPPSASNGVSPGILHASGGDAAAMEGGAVGLGVPAVLSGCRSVSDIGTGGPSDIAADAARVASAALLLARQEAQIHACLTVV